MQNGVLTDERRALRIAALCALGRGPQARGEAHAFAQDRPNSPLAQQVSSACPQDPSLPPGRNP